MTILVDWLSLLLLPVSAGLWVMKRLWHMPMSSTALLHIPAEYLIVILLCKLHLTRLLQPNAAAAAAAAVAVLVHTKCDTGVSKRELPAEQQCTVTHTTRAAAVVAG
jgi:hypothetical protein